MDRDLLRERALAHAGPCPEDRQLAAREPAEPVDRLEARAHALHVLERGGRQRLGARREYIG